MTVFIHFSGFYNFIIRIRRNFAAYKSILAMKSRYTGSFDPMRAVSNFAGVAGSADANSNQIVIRGNSPKGLLWRVDGIDIPNPNHFAYVGTSGGAVTMFSSQVLSNSDFYTAAFPAEYGNGISGECGRYRSRTCSISSL